MQIKDHCFLIAGGASGLGAAAARLLRDAGARVVIADLDAAGATTAARLGSDARFIRTDVTNEAEIGRAHV